jgi:hypothetical protein
MNESIFPNLGDDILKSVKIPPPGETRWMPLMEAELQESHGFSNIRVAQSLVFCVVLLIFWREMFAFFLSKYLRGNQNQPI